MNSSNWIRQGALNNQVLVWPTGKVILDDKIITVRNDGSRRFMNGGFYSCAGSFPILHIFRVRKLCPNRCRFQKVSEMFLFFVCFDHSWCVSLMLPSSGFMSSLFRKNCIIALMFFNKPCKISKTVGNFWKFPEISRSFA